MSVPFERYPLAPSNPIPLEFLTPDLHAVVGSLESLLQAEPHGSPLRYPLRVALQFARMAEGLAINRPPNEADALFADFDPQAAHMPCFAKMAELLGPGLTYILIERYGNARLYIPTVERLHEGHALSRSIGHTGAMALAKEFGGSSVKVPSGHWAILHARNAQIHERYAKGETAAKLAREYGMAEDSVYRIVNRARQGHVETLAWPERFETFDLFAPLDVQA